MIYIVLRAPNGDGTFSPVLGLTTGDTAQTINGVLCVPGCINKGSVSKLSDSMDISQAKGGIPQGIQWSFDLIDWTGAARRSAGLLNGGTRFVGWRAALYISRRGNNSTPSPVCGSADYFAINGCSASDGVVQLKCIAAWALDASLVSFKSGTQSVGLVVGGHAVSVPTEALPEPVVLTRKIETDYRFGTPNDPTQGIIDSSAPNFDIPVSDPHRQKAAVFNCLTSEDAQAFFDKIVVRSSFFRGRSKSSIVSEKQIYSDSPKSVYVWAWRDDDMYGEVAADVSICEGQTSAVICAGAASLIGLGSDLFAIPDGDISISSNGGDQQNILSITPSSITLDSKFRAFTRLSPVVAFYKGQIGADLTYTGAIQNISVDPLSLPLFASLDSVYVPTTPTPFSSTKKVTSTDPTGTHCPIKLVLDSEIESNYKQFIVDFRAKFSIGDMPGVWKLFGIDKYIGNGMEMTQSLEGASRIYQDSTLGKRFSSIAEINAGDEPESSNGLTGTFYPADASAKYSCCQIANIILYGVSMLSFSSNYAQVQPGASPWWTAPVTPGEVVAALSGNVSGPVYPSIPDGPLRTPVSWGEYIAPDKTYMDAAVKLCEEFWITLAETNVSKDATGNELLTVPSIDMGSYTDVVTEPVIEYAPVGGAYTKKAYISNVDQAFDASRPGDFYGGWGKADDQDFGFEIWKICREAYKATGTKASETYQADGIHEEYHIGLEWMQRTRAGVNRISWLAYPPRYMTFSILDDEAPSWWSGAQVNPPKSMAGFAGYNVPAGAFTVVAKEFDPMTCEASFTVALPPLVSTGTTNRIIQTANPANDRIVQSLTAVDKITQIIEA